MIGHESGNVCRAAGFGPAAAPAPAPAGGGYHDYELVLPYGDSVDFHGLQVNPDALFEAPSDRSATRYLAYGDSITHGFTASDIGGGYAFRVAEAKGWQLVNMGYGGRASTIADGTVVGKFSNNKSMNLWQIPVCRFTSEDGLRREGNNVFSATEDSGQMEMGVAGTENYGKINAYNIENSNVDMATEMVNMIVNQRGFQSNSKVVTTADQLLQKAMELKRS